jgi:predicted DNA-binding protein (UPF0251 family)
MATQELEVSKPDLRGRHFTATEVDAQAIEALRLKILGTRDVDIAVKLGISRPTVNKRLQQAIATHGQATVAEHREIAKQRLEVALLALGPGVERGDYEAVGKWVAATAAYAKLVGAEAPVQAEVHVTVETEQEKQLRDLLAQAERDEKVRESEIVDAEVVESDGRG